MPQFVDKNGGDNVKWEYTEHKNFEVTLTQDNAQYEQSCVNIRLTHFFSQSTHDCLVVTVSRCDEINWKYDKKKRRQKPQAAPPPTFK